MANTVTKCFVVAAALLGGLLAGMAVDKALVQLPAWRQAGVLPWADFSRRADLGRGLIVYPGIGIAALLCSVAAAVSYTFDRQASPSAAIPIYAAAVLAVLALMVTRFGIAPDMLRIRAVKDDPSALEHAFAAVQRWWPTKAGLHLLTFVANLWSIIALTKQVH